MIYLSLLMAIRFLGLFIVMPVLALYAMHLKGADEFSVGIALGAYAFSQLILQIPFGKLADKFNKKLVLIIGLILLLLGSLVCAFSTDIYTLIFGRLLQGAGAIGGVVLAYMADLTDEKNRSKAFAKMGQFIAISFAISMIISPTIGTKYGVDKLFLLTAILSFISILIVIFKVPQPKIVIHHQEKTSIKEILKNRFLIPLFFSGFMQKGLMSVFFLLIPIIFTAMFKFDKSELWKIYIPALIVGFFALPLGAILAEKKQKGKLVFLISSVFITLALVLFFISILINSTLLGIISVIAFFFGFNLIEPVIQSFVSKFSKANQKATSLAVSNTIQYFGIFLGGSVAGYFLKHFSINLFFIFAIILGIIWIIQVLKMKDIKSFKIIEYTNFDETFIEELKSQSNVYDFYQKENKLIVRYIFVPKEKQ